MISILTSLTFFKLFLGTFLALFAIVLHKAILLPYLKVRAKKRDGVETYFFPLIGVRYLRMKDEKTNNDNLASAKQFCKNFPDKKILATNIGFNVMIQIRDTQYAKDFFLKQNLYQKANLAEVVQMIMGNGLVFAEGDIWKRHRKIISNHFNYDLLKANVQIMQNTTREFLNKNSPDDYKNYPAISKVQEITGEIVGRIFFGERLNNYTFEGKPLTLALADIMVELVNTTMQPIPLICGAKILDFPLFPTYNKLARRVRAFRQVCLSIIHDQKKSQSDEGNYLLKSLLATQKSEDPEQRYSDDDIINEFITFFVAGMDTTGHLIGMTLYNLATHPQYTQRLREEIRNTYNLDDVVTAETLNNMTVLHSILKETLRVHAPIDHVVPRVALSDHNILDMPVKKGEFITVDFFPLLFDEKHFDNPHNFDPDRWNNPDQKLDSFAYTPFSAGSRNCIGQHLAYLEAKVIISEFLKKFEFELVEGFNLRMVVKVLYEPDNDVRLHLKAINT